jgi:hypothetical protein
LVVAMFGCCVKPLVGIGAGAAGGAAGGGL